MDYSPLGYSVHGIFQQEYCSELPFPSPGELPDPGIGPASPALAGGFFSTEPPGKPLHPLTHREKFGPAWKEMYMDLGESEGIIYRGWLCAVLSLCCPQGCRIWVFAAWNGKVDKWYSQYANKINEINSEGWVVLFSHVFHWKTVKMFAGRNWNTTLEHSKVFCNT